MGPIVVIDVETTGLDPARDAVIQVAALSVGADGAKTLRSWFVDPCRPIPAAIYRLTGFRPDDFRGAPPLDQVADEIRSVIGTDDAVVGHHVSFDLAFLAPLGIRGETVIDTQEWAHVAFPGRSSYRLSDFGYAGRYPAHDARGDVEATWRLLEAIRDRLGSLPAAIQAELGRILAPEWAWWDIRSSGSRPSPLHDPPREVFADGRLDPVEVPVDPVQELSGGGALGDRLAGFEPRKAQHDMAEAVVEAQAQGRILLVEAGTGTGKSLAYLLPSAAESLRAGRRVVVATYTLALMEQLWQKDWPTAGADLPARATMLKGKGRYACLFKVEERVGSARPLTDPRADRFALAALLVFVAVSERGDVEELNPRGGPLLRLWAEVVADRRACRGASCRFAGACFMRQARRQAEESHLIIVNHALLAAHAAQGGVLPEFSHLIVDEAHHLQEVAEQAFGFSLDLAAWGEELTDWERQGLAHLGERTRAHPTLAAALAALRSEAREAASRADALAKELALGLDFGDYPTVSVRVTAAVRAQWDAGAVGPRLAALAESAVRLAERGREAWTEAEGVFGDGVTDEAGFLRLEKWVEDLDGMATGLQLWGTLEADWVSWWEGNQTGRRPEPVIRLRRAPLNVGELLRSALWDTVESAVLTSATLSVGGRFEFIERSLGIPSDRARRMRLPSPFRLAEQARLLIPEGLPPVDSTEHRAALATFVVRAAEMLGGRTLVLLNSNRALAALDRAIRPRLRDEGLMVLAQGLDGTGPWLVDRFRKTPGAVLLGVASLWEGVDVPGDALVLVIIGRLPFATPGDPLEEARLERIRREGGNPFSERSLPQAILRFQQGVGRLIRTASDRGAAVVFDPRILDKRYGQEFLRAVRPVPTVVGDMERIGQEVADLGASLKATACRSDP